MKHIQKRFGIKGKIFTFILGVAGVIYWIAGKVQIAIESLYENY